MSDLATDLIIHVELTESELSFLLGVMTSTFHWRYKSTSDHMLLFQRLQKAKEQAAHRRKNAKNEISSR